MDDEDDEYNGLETQMRLESLVCFFCFNVYSTNSYLQIATLCHKTWARLQKRAQMMVCHRLGPILITLICIHSTYLI
jgi:hypothetical protein